MSLLVGNYARQYGGLVINGKRVLYANGAYLTPAQQDTLRQQLAPAGGHSTHGLGGLLQSFADRAVRTCDGGASYFGAEIDLGSRRVGKVQFNERGVVAGN